MQIESSVLYLTAASIGFFHTLLGPDHYLPFIVISKARKWSLWKTNLITFICGIGHVASSVIIGFIGIFLGVAVNKLTPIEASRGSVAAWLMIAFGLVYFIWGMRKAYKKKEKDARQAYMKMADEMYDIVRMFRDLKGRNVVFSAKRESRADADTGLTQYIPSAPGKAVGDFLPYQFDEVFYMTFHESDSGKKERVLITETSYEHDAKDRSGELNKMERPNLTKIFRKISGKSKSKRKGK